MKHFSCLSSNIGARNAIIVCGDGLAVDGGHIVDCGSNECSQTTSV